MRIFTTFRLMSALTLALLPLSTAPAMAGPSDRQAPKNPDVQVAMRVHQLPNGLRLLMHEDHKAPVVTFEVWYQVGSKDERPGITGVSHLLEHMMFQGAKKYATGEFDKVLVRNGGQNNAFTTEDYTAYYEVMSSDRLDLAFDLEADRMTGAAIPPDKLISEKQVVKEELRWRTENSPVGAVWEFLSAFVFLAHPYHWPVGGYTSDMDAMTHEQVVAYYKSYYQPNNATIVIVGDFQAENAIAMAQQYFGSLPAAAAFPRNPTKEPPQNGERRAEILKKVETPIVLAAYRLPGAGHPDLYALDLLDTILSNGKSSRLYQDLVYKGRVAQEVDAGTWEGKDAGLFYVYGQPMPGKQAAELEQALYAQVERLRNQPVTEREYHKALNIAESTFIFGQESSEDLATAIGTRASLTTPEDLNHYLTRLRAVTRQDLQRVARTYLRPANRTVITLRPDSVAKKTANTHGGTK